MKIIWRKLKLSDANDIYEYGKLDLVTKYLTWNSYKSIDEAKKFIIDVASQAKLNIFGIEVDGKICGTISGEIKLPNEIWIGYALSPQIWGKGVADRSLKFMIEKLKMNFPHFKIMAEAEKGNIYSQNVLKRNGFNFIKKISRKEDKIIMLEIYEHQ